MLLRVEAHYKMRRFLIDFLNGRAGNVLPFSFWPLPVVRECLRSLGVPTKGVLAKRHDQKEEGT